VELAFTPEQRSFARAVRELLERACPPSHVRWAARDPVGRSPALWRALADLGVQALTVPEADGGLGRGMVDLVLPLEEAGRAALPEPLVETVAVAAPLLAAGSDEARAAWLPPVAAGDAVLAVAGLAGPAVADAHVAALVLVARDDRIEALRREDLALTRHPSLDPTRRLFTLEARGPATAVLAGPAARAAVVAAFDRGALGTAALLLGIADRVIEMAATHARERHQFGRPIGAFQAVKHLLADALLSLEFARPAVYRAAWSVDVSSPDRARDVSMAKALASEAAVGACRAALQVHGAIGYTHEHDLHLWLTKGFALAQAWGDAARHRDRVARAVLDRA
jgi:alkylation response protein AidB-like acyl-CoA dehydrogenase